MEFVRRPPVFVDDDARQELCHYFIPHHYEDGLDSVLLTHGQVIDRIEKLAADMCCDYKEGVHFLCVLKGASMFFHALCESYGRMHSYNRLSHIPFTFDFVRVKSYQGTGSSGAVSISGCDVESLAGKHVVIVEDIIDTGLTMTSLIDTLRSGTHPPASVRVAALLEKRTHLSNGFVGDYVGFSIPDNSLSIYSVPESCKTFMVR